MRREGKIPGIPERAAPAVCAEGRHAVVGDILAWQVAQPVGQRVGEVSHRGLRQLRDTAMEDTGTLQSLTWLARAGRVDVRRVLVLRTVSNFDQQEEGMTAAESLFGEKLGSYSAYGPALESAYRVGSTVVTNSWPTGRATRTLSRENSGRARGKPRKVVRWPTRSLLLQP